MTELIKETLTNKFKKSFINILVLEINNTILVQFESLEFNNLQKKLINYMLFDFELDNTFNFDDIKNTTFVNEYNFKNETFLLKFLFTFY